MLSIRLSWKSCASFLLRLPLINSCQAKSKFSTEIIWLKKLCLLGKPPPNGKLSILSHLLATYKLWHETVRRFPKDQRYTLGAKITELYIEMLQAIFLASTSSGVHKIKPLKIASLKLDLLKFFMQVAWGIKALDNKKYSVFAEQHIQIGKMLGGWLKDSLSKFSKTNPA